MSEYSNSTYASDNGGVAEAQPAELAVVEPVAPAAPAKPGEETHDPFLYLGSTPVDETAIESSEQGFGYLSEPAS